MAEAGRRKPGVRRDIPIAVLGMGHVGLPTALGLAELGWKVMGADDAAEKIEQLKAGQSPFYEPKVQDLLRKHLKSGRFRPTADVEEAIAASKVLFVCVGTPQREDGAADLSQIEALARTIARNLNGYKVIVEKSTVPAATSARIKKTIARYARLERAAKVNNGRGGPNGRRRDAGAPVRFDVASNPEFLQEGKAVEDFFHPDRIVIGVEEKESEEELRELYRPILEGSYRCPVHQPHCPPARTPDSPSAKAVSACSPTSFASPTSPAASKFPAPPPRSAPSWNTWKPSTMEATPARRRCWNRRAAACN